MNWIELHSYITNGSGYKVKGESIAVNVNNIKYIRGNKHSDIYFVDDTILQVYEGYEEIIKGNK